MAQHITLRGGRLQAGTPAENHFSFDFDPSRAVFVKQGSDLLIQPSEGSPTILENFFVFGNKASTPEFILPDDTVLKIKDFFQAFSPDLVTAAGPAPEAPSSGGGEYFDGAGDLLGGVERFGALGAAAGSPFVAVAREVEQTATVALAADLPGQPTTPGVSDPVPTDPQMRMVVYGDDANPASWAPGISAKLPLAAVSATNGAYGTANVLPGGSVQYIPFFDAADRSEDGGPLADKIIVTFSDGSMKMIEVLIVDGTAHDAAGHSDLGGEFHEGLLEESYNVTTTAYDDVFVRRTGSTGFLSGSSLDMGAGDDSLRVQIEVTGRAARGTEKSTLLMGVGNDSVDISATTSEYSAYAVSAGRLDTGDGNDTLRLQAMTKTTMMSDARVVGDGASVSTGTGNDVVELAASASGYMGSAYGVSSSSKVDLGSGDNSLSMNVSASRNGSGIHSNYGVTGNNRSSVTACDGNDTLKIVVRDASLGTGIDNGYVSLGNGNNLLDINVGGSGWSTVYGMTKGEVVMGNGNDTLTLKLNTSTGSGYGIHDSIVNMGDGDNLISVTDAAYGIYSAVSMGSGNDRILVDSTNSTGSGKYGIYGSLPVNMGAGNDLVRINLAGASDAEALRTASLNMGDGDDTVAFVVSATGWSGGGMNDGARLNTGNGNDLVTVNVATQGSGSMLAFGMHNSSQMDLGTGDDTLRMDISLNGTQQGADAYVYGVTSGARVTVGAGNDSVTIRTTASAAKAGATAESDGINSAVVTMGIGNDTLLVEAQSSGSNAQARALYAMYGIQTLAVDTGDGDDLITLNASASGSASSLAVGIHNVALDAGIGNDTLNLGATAAGGNATAAALTQGKALLGDGNDNVFIEVTSQGKAYGFTEGTNASNQTAGSLLDLGNGNDVLTMHVHGDHDAYGVYKSTLSAGEGNDVVTINVDGGNAYGLYASSLNMGNGGDHLTIGVAGSGLSTAMIYSAIDMAAGDDVLNLSGGLGDGSSVLGGSGKDTLHVDGGLVGTGVLLDGGADDDLIGFGLNFSMSAQARVQGGTGIDVLSLDAGLERFDFTEHTGQITGLERLDLTQGAHEVTLGLNDVLALTDDSLGVALDAALRINSDGDDTVHLTGSGWQINGDNIVTLADGNGGTHNYYTAVNGTTTVYIDEQVRLDMLVIAG